MTAAEPFGTTKALTPVHRHLGVQASPLLSHSLPNVPSPTTEGTRRSLSTPTPASPMLSRLRRLPASSPSRTAESSSSSYGPPVRLRLLPTPPHDDAVTFDYGALAYPDTDSHRAENAPPRAHWEPPRRRSPRQSRKSPKSPRHREEQSNAAISKGDRTGHPITPP